MRHFKSQVVDGQVKADKHSIDPLRRTVSTKDKHGLIMDDTQVAETPIGLIRAATFHWLAAWSTKNEIR
jgi:hypothetical protein